MSDDRVSLIQDLFQEALERPRSEHEAFLKNACGDDTDLSGRVIGLLEAHYKAGDFLVDPTISETQSRGGSTGLDAGEKIGRYKLLQEIGEGGYGIVYMAEQMEPVSRMVAIKVLKLGMDTKQVIARFEAERQALAMMEHQNIARVLDAGSTEAGRPYFVMDLVKGVPVTDYCDTNALSVRERLALFIPICRALHHAHQKGIIHRDLKPSNILVTLHDGQPVPKVIDFGIAKAMDTRLTDKTLFTEFRQFVGTPAYVSPEQAEMSGLDVDTRSDIYSLGVLLYELVTGETPFDGETLRNVAIGEMQRIIREVQPLKPSTRVETMDDAQRTLVAKHRELQPAMLKRHLSGDLDWIAMKALEKDRTRRYETAYSFAQDVERFLNDEPVEATAPTVGYLLFKAAKRLAKNRLAASLALLAAVLAIGGLSGILWQWHRAERHADRESELANEAREALVRIEIERADDLLSRGNSSEGLAYLAHTVRTQPENRPAAQRLWSALTYRSWAHPLFPPIDPGDGEIGALAFSPNEAFVAIGTSGGSLAIHHTRDGALLGSTKLGGAVNSLDFSPNGERVLAADASGGAHIFDIEAHPVARLTCEGIPTHLVEFDSKGERCLAATGDHRVRVWSVATGELLHSNIKHDAVIHAARFSPDGARIATASEDHTARIWRADDGKATTAPIKHSENPTTPLVGNVSWHPDGHHILTACHETWSGTMFNSTTGKQSGKPFSHQGPVTDATFSPDGQLAATASRDYSVRVWRAGRSQLTLPPLEHDTWVTWLEFSDTGTRLATATFDNRIRIWNPITGRHVVEPIQSLQPLTTHALSAGGALVAGGSENGTVQVWDVRPGGAIPETLARDGHAEIALFDPSGKLLLTAGWDAIRLRAWPSGDIVASVEFPGVNHACFNADSSLFAASSITGDVMVWDSQNARPRFAEGTINHEQASRVTFGREDQIATVDIGGNVRVWNARTGANVSSMGLIHRAVARIALSPQGDRLVTASHDNFARIWDLSGAPVGAEIHTGALAAGLDIEATGNLVALGSRDATIRVLNLRTGLPHCRPMRHAGSVESVAFAPRSSLLASGGMNGARIWDTATALPVTPPLDPTSRIRGVSFSRSGTHLVTSTEEGTAKLWDVPSPTPGPTQALANLAERIAGRRVDPDGVFSAPVEQTAEVLDDWFDWFQDNRDRRTLSPGQSQRRDALVLATQSSASRADYELALDYAGGDGKLLWNYACTLFAKRNRPDAMERLRIEAIVARAVALDDTTSQTEWVDRCINVHESADYALANTLGNMVANRIDPSDPSFAKIPVHTQQGLAKAYYRQAMTSLRLNSIEKARDGFLRLLKLGEATDSLYHQWLGIGGHRNALYKLGVPPEDVIDYPFPARATDTPAVCIDLSKFYNAAFFVDTGPPTPGLYGEIYFDVRACLVMPCTKVTFDINDGRTHYPKEIRGIPIGDTARSVHFLHTAWGSTAAGSHPATYQIHYSDGSVERIPIRIGERTGHGHAEVSVSQSEEIWRRTGDGGLLRIFSTKWENPHADRTISTIDIIAEASKTGLTVYGITLGD